MKIFSLVSITITIFLPLVLIGRIAMRSDSLPPSQSEDHWNMITQDSPQITVVDTEPMTYIGLEATVDAAHPENIDSTMSNLYGQLIKYSEESGTESIGAPIAVYTSFGEDVIEVICGLPVEEGYVIHHDEIELGRTLGGKAVKTVHKGAYNKLPFTHEKVNQYIKNQNLRVVGYPYEMYITGPTQVADTAQWITEIYYPLGGE